MKKSTDIIEKFKVCKIFIGMDSAPAHIAVLNGVHSIIVTNGNHYGRFFPYVINDEVLPNPEILMPTELNELDFESRILKTMYGSEYNINKIDPFQLIELLQKKLNLSIIQDIFKNKIPN